MSKPIKFSTAIASGLVVLSLGATASAEDVKESKSDDGYGYEFSDDPLSAGGFGPNDARIRVRRGAQRATLIKPRTQFINELLKSVENL
jgi:hypothetical protein